MGAVQSGGGLGKGIDPSSGTQSAKTSTFQSSGQFTKQTYTTQVDVLVVAGGGGASEGAGSAGGGGGFRKLTNSPVTTSDAIAVTVGAGGAATDNGTKGEDSVFANPAAPITSTGGGKGHPQGYPAAPLGGAGNGGSGGGAGYNYNTPGNNEGPGGEGN